MERRDDHSNQNWNRNWKKTISVKFEEARSIRKHSKPKANVERSASLQDRTETSPVDPNRALVCGVPDE